MSVSGDVNLGEYPDIHTGINPVSLKTFSGRMEEVKRDLAQPISEYFPDPIAAAASTHERYEAVIRELEKFDYHGPVLVTGGLGGNAWYESLYGFSDFDRMFAWLGGDWLEYTQLGEAIDMYNERAVGAPEKPLRIPRKKTERLAIVRNLLLSEKAITGEEWLVYVTTLDEYLEALRTGGDVPSYASAEAQEAQTQEQSNRIREAYERASIIAEDITDITPKGPIM
jgi:hypothetical protein